MNYDERTERFFPWDGAEIQVRSHEPARVWPSKPQPIFDPATRLILRLAVLALAVGSVALSATLLDVAVRVILAV